MAKLKVSLKGDNSSAGNHRYHNEVNAENFKEVAIVLSDLKNLGLPIDKAVKELNHNKRNDWDDLIGIGI